MTEPIDVAKHAAGRGASIVRRYFEEGVTIRNKGAYDLVSDADIESEKAIVALIRESFPGHAILAEEEHRDEVTSEHLWIVDPLDGTNNFAHHVPHFAVSIAYYHNGQAECGVVVNPVRDEWYVAERGRGAWFNDQRVETSQHSELSEVLIGVGFYYDRGAMMEATLGALRDLFGCGIHGIRRFGTAALDLCQVGMGMFGAFFEFELSPWDFAAGRLFVEESGGFVTTCDGASLPLQKCSVLASNGKLHPAVLEIVDRHYKTLV